MVDFKVYGRGHGKYCMGALKVNFWVKKVGLGQLACKQKHANTCKKHTKTCKNIQKPLVSFILSGMTAATLKISVFLSLHNSTAVSPCNQRENRGHNWFHPFMIVQYSQFIDSDSCFAVDISHDLGLHAWRWGLPPTPGDFPLSSRPGHAGADRMSSSGGLR